MDIVFNHHQFVFLQSSILAGRFSTGLPAIAVITCIGAMTQGLAILVLLFKQQWVPDLSIINLCIFQMSTLDLDKVRLLIPLWVVVIQFSYERGMTYIDQFCRHMCKLIHCGLCGLLWSYGEGWIDYLLLGGLAVAWGIGDAAFNTQISALLGIFYPEDTVRDNEYHTCI